MNIFENETGIIGDASIEHLQRSFEELLQQAREIRVMLGKQGYLLDKYLSYLFESSNETLAYEAACEGFEVAGELNRLFLELIQNNCQYTDHAFYEQAKAYIEAHPLAHQEPHTKLSLYYCALDGSFLKFAYKQYFDRVVVNSHAVLDVCDLQSLYSKICDLLGSEDAMVNLNLLFRQRFLITTAMAAFLQGTTNQLMYSLTYRDRETSKQVFQLLLDSKT